MKETRTILVVDDEVKIVEVLQAYLKKHGFQTIAAHTGTQAMEILKGQHVDLVVLDLMLPDITGEEICQSIRTKSTIPIIMLTAKVEDCDLVHGLQIGADDYIVKPFSPRAVVAKVEALLRRVHDMEETPDILVIGELRIDFEQVIVKRGEEEITLTPTEFKLLKTLVQNPGRIFTRDQLISFALEDQFEGFDRTIDTYIKSICNKIEPDRKNPIYILTVYGIGYKFASKAEVR